MSDNEGYWTLGIQVNRKIENKTYISARLYVPSSDLPELLKWIEKEGHGKLHFRRKFHGRNIILTEVQTQTEMSTPRPSLAQRADEIIRVIAQLGGTSTWPAVREKLGLPTNSTPSPFLVKLLRDRGLQTTKNPKTSTMTWKLIDREKLNGWTTH
ncbi:MAG TPA: hypothetical protein VE862_04595 [Candidatus Acidoferrum sp.]|nr:hypothetical protein [Candidatus Acidoferrum sp.]